MLGGRERERGRGTEVFFSNGSRRRIREADLWPSGLPDFTDKAPPNICDVSPPAPIPPVHCLVRVPFCSLAHGDGCIWATTACSKQHALEGSKLTTALFSEPEF